MSPHQADVVATSSPAGLPYSQDDAAQVRMVTHPADQTHPREIVRLFQCRVCSLPFSDPITLPCGRTVCRKCLPASHTRVNITYPGNPGRLQGFRCPFDDCGKEHAIGDCGVDVILNKTVSHVREQIQHGMNVASEVGVRTRLTVQDPWEVAGITSLQPPQPFTQSFDGEELIATWMMAEQGDLKFEAEVTYEEIRAPENVQHQRQEASSEEKPLVETESSSETKPVDEKEALSAMESLPEEALSAKEPAPKLDPLRLTQEKARTEMDCQVCYGLFCDPMTVGCGHTFCRSCLHRILDHSQHCPMCRRKLALNPLLNRLACPSNERLTRIIETFWIDELTSRREFITAEQVGQHEDFDTALFVCTLSFPVMPTFLHIFEPRYRLMIRRALDGNRTFGMVLPKRARNPGDANFHEMGTLLRIINVQYYPDGRSLIETTGVSRFRVTRHGVVDGYAMGDIERIEDISIEEEEALEAREALPTTISQADTSNRDNNMASPENSDSKNDEGDKGSSSDPSSDPSSQPSTQPRRSVRFPERVSDLETMTTQNLMAYALDFVARMTTQSVPWLTERMLTIYGECPNDAALFPWWFASMLPVRDLEKYRLLGTSSVRERLKICCSWIVEWETSRW